jgi:hypothetical protein
MQSALHARVAQQADANHPDSIVLLDAWLQVQINNELSWDIEIESGQEITIDCPTNDTWSPVSHQGHVITCYNIMPVALTPCATWVHACTSRRAAVMW